VDGGLWPGREVGLYDSNGGIWPEYHGRCFVRKVDGDFDVHILKGLLAHIHFILGSACGHS
jgi:hypothetical protein